ncbi:MAG TPA: hypothetical protein VMP03_10175 [Methylomirabilota bacterium]|nr:hypothetical protein [Methylomirabilota bacterium]
MGTIVQFHARLASARREKPDRPCEVTIFPGVRYDRRDAAERAERLAIEITAAEGLRAEDAAL